MTRKRTDAERRIRQCERLGRLLRTLRCIMGPGRWDAAGLADELQCSTRTVHRLLQTLTLAGVPWYFHEGLRAYKVRPGFKFPGIEAVPHSEKPPESDPLLERLEGAVRKLITQSEGFRLAIEDFLGQLRSLNPRRLR